MSFSIYLDINSHNPDPGAIRNVVIVVAIGAFLTRMAAYYLKIPNLKFRSEPETRKTTEALDETSEK